MKKTIAVLVGLFLVALIGIFAWVNVTNSRLQRLEQDSKDRVANAKMIPVTLAVKPPANTPADQPLYVCGDAPDLGNWEATRGKQMEKRPDGSYAVTVELQRGRAYSFKVNRGTWSTVERDEKGNEIANHTFEAADNKPIEVSVASWVDEGKTVPGRTTIAGVTEMLPKFRSKTLENERDIIVYLPPGYGDNEDQRYPVLYMQDGQNLFNEASSFKGIEWKMDETAQRLIGAGVTKPMIIVGVYNAGEFRANEFTPPSVAADAKAAKGDQYAKFLAEELKPFIDQRYRTMPEREHTAIGGSAQGGLIALTTAKNHKAVFGSVAVCSPWLRGPDGNKKLLPDFASGDWMKGTRFYIDMGNKGGGAGYPPFTEHTNSTDPKAAQNAIADAKEFVAALGSAGLQQGKDYLYEEVANGEYNEPSWQSRVEPMLTFLFKGDGKAPGSQPNAMR